MKVTRILCSLLLVPFISPLFAVAADFSDVKSTDTYAPAIYALKNLGIIDGFPDGNFKPHLFVNRAEALKMIMGSTVPTIPEVSVSGFPDVAASQWYAKYVSLARDKNIISGYPDGTFRGAELINFGEILKITFRSFGVVATGSYSEALMRVTFPGYTGKEWFLPYMMYAKEKNMLLLTEPGAYPTRAQIAELLYRMIIIQKYQLDRFEEKDVMLYTQISRAEQREDTFSGALLTSLDTSPLLMGTDTKLTMPFILRHDLATKKDETLALVNGLINETDVIHAKLVMQNSIIGTKISDFDGSIIMIKNALSVLKNQLVNNTTGFSVDEERMFYEELLQSRKEIVRIYARLELAVIQTFLEEKSVLSAFSAFSEHSLYKELASHYEQITTLAQKIYNNIGTISLQTDEFYIYSTIIEDFATIKEHMSAIKAGTIPFLQVVNS